MEGRWVICDYALVWEESGLEVIRKLAAKNPDGFAIAARLILQLDAVECCIGNR